MYKRNQVEAAISRAHEPGSKALSKVLRTKLKRLLETDRSLRRSPRARNPERANYAFFSAGPPGSGVEIPFSGYEAFALYTAWRLLEHGFPQASSVSILRRARKTLERKHAEILRWDPAKIFDEKKILELAKPGTLATSTTRPVFLVIASRQGRPIKHASDPNREVEILEENELMPFLLREAGLSITSFELVRASHDLDRALARVPARKRGRGG